MITTTGGHDGAAQPSRSAEKASLCRNNSQGAPLNQGLSAVTEGERAEMEAEVEVLRALVELERNERQELMGKVTALQKQVLQSMPIRMALESIFSLQRGIHKHMQGGTQEGRQTGRQCVFIRVCMCVCVCSLLLTRVAALSNHRNCNVLLDSPTGEISKDHCKRGKWHHYQERSAQGGVPPQGHAAPARTRRNAGYGSRMMLYREKKNGEGG